MRVFLTACAGNLFDGCGLVPQAGQQAEQPKFETPFPPETHSASSTFQRPPAHGTQYYFEGVPDDIVGEPRRHLAADLQVSGEAKYTDDVQLPADALHGALLFSKKPHAKLLKVDASKVRATMGFTPSASHMTNTYHPIMCTLRKCLPARTIMHTVMDKMHHP